MALKINKSCVSCDMCLPACPNQAISIQSSIYIIDHERCTQCVGFYNKPKCIDVCPIDCIVLDLNHIETEQELQDKHEKLHN